MNLNHFAALLISVSAPCFAGMAAGPDTLAAPGIIAAWNDNSLTAACVTLYDNSTSEAGYRIYRAQGYSAPFRPIARIASAKPTAHDTIVFYDSTVVPNRFYRYKAVAERGRDTAASAVSTIFTFKLARPATLAHFTRLASIPIALDKGWSALAGDSVIVQESGAMAGKFSVIDVSDPAAPRRAGHIDSTALLAYPPSTLIPLYGATHIVNRYGFTGGRALFWMRNRYVVVVNSPDISVFQGSHGRPKITAAYRDQNIAGVVPLNDSILCVLSGNVNTVDGSYSYLYPMTVAATGELVIGNPLEAGSNRYGAMASSITPWLRGLFDNTLLIGETFADFPYNSWKNLVACDVDSMQSITFSDVGASSWESFSGYLLSHGQSLALDESHLYAEDPRDPDALQTALDNKAVLPDSFPARKNVLVDTVKGRLYILSASRLAIYRYDFLPTKSGSAVTPRQQMRGELRVLPSHSGVTIILPGSARQATLFFHDTFGHVVDHVAVSGTNSVAWRPKDPGNGCFSVTTTIDGVSYEASFVAR